MSFREWIISKHINSDSPIGDLARDINEDPEFPNNINKNINKSYLDRKRACKGCLETFEKAWKEYKEERIKKND